jgi:hypothetical protein
MYGFQGGENLSSVSFFEDAMCISLYNAHHKRKVPTIFEEWW